MARQSKLKAVVQVPTRSRRRTTSLTLTGEDLAALVRLVAQGQLILQMGYPVVARLKAAMTRLGLPAPKGL